MNIPDLINQATEAILHFDIVKFLKNTKAVVIILAIIAMILISLGALFSLIPQF